MNEYARCGECKRSGATIGVLLCEKVDSRLRATRRQLCRRCRQQLRWRPVDFSRATNTSAPPDTRPAPRIW